MQESPLTSRRASGPPAEDQTRKTVSAQFPDFPCPHRSCHMYYELRLYLLLAFTVSVGVWALFWSWVYPRTGTEHGPERLMEGRQTDGREGEVR